MARLVLLLVLTATGLLSGPPLSFRIFTTQDGLVRNWVTKIHRDSHGFLWLCTVEGVSLFDGYRFSNFSTADGLPSRLVVDMIETSHGDFWFATQGGLARFRKNHRNSAPFEIVRVGDSKASNDIQALYEGHDGTIWCGTAAGLYSLGANGNVPAVRDMLLDGSDPLEVRALVEDSHRNLWAATSKGLVRRRSNGEAALINVALPPLPHQRINSLLVDAGERLWAGGYGLAAMDTKIEPPRALPPEDIPKTDGSISVLYMGDDHEIWIGGSAGLVRFHPDAPQDIQVYAPSDEFPIQHVGAVGEDVRHNLWAAIGTRGVIRIAAGSVESFTRADGLPSLEVLGVVEGLRGTVYAVTGQWTLNEFRGGRFVPIPLRLPSDTFTWGLGQTLVQDRYGTWWAASGAGVARYRAGTDARDLKGKLRSGSIPFATDCPARLYSECSRIRMATSGPVPPMAWVIGTAAQDSGERFEPRT